MRTLHHRAARSIDLPLLLPCRCLASFCCTSTIRVCLGDGVELVDLTAREVGLGRVKAHLLSNETIPHGLRSVKSLEGR